MKLPRQGDLSPRLQFHCEREVAITAPRHSLPRMPMPHLDQLFSSFASKLSASPYDSGSAYRQSRHRGSDVGREAVSRRLAAKPRRRRRSPPRPIEAEGTGGRIARLKRLPRDLQINQIAGQPLETCEPSRPLRFNGPRAANGVGGKDHREPSRNRLPAQHRFPDDATGGAAPTRSRKARRSTCSRRS